MSDELVFDADVHLAVPHRMFSREFLTLACATALFFVAMGATNPIMPKFAQRELGANETVVGVVVGSFAVGSLLTRPFFGRLGDRRGARLLMVLGGGLGAMAMLATTLVDSVGVAVLARMPGGMAQAAVMTGATALAIQLAPIERRGEAASYILVAFHLGLGLGPLIGEFVLKRSSFDGVWLVLALTMAASGVVAAFLPRRLPERHDGPVALLHRQGIGPGIVIALGMSSFIGFSTFVPLYAKELGLEDVGPVFTVSSVAIALVRIVLGKVPDRLGPIRASTMALVAISIGGAVLAAWSSVAGLYVGAVVLAGGGAMIMPALVPVAVDGVDQREHASALAAFTMFIDVAVVSTGPIFGLIASGMGYRSVFVAGVFTTWAALAVLRGGVSRRWYHNHPVTRTASSP